MLPEGTVINNARTVIAMFKEDSDGFFRLPPMCNVRHCELRDINDLTTFQIYAEVADIEPNVGAVYKFILTVVNSGEEIPLNANHMKTIVLRSNRYAKDICGIAKHYYLAHVE